MGSQQAKTDGIQMNVIGHKLDDDPAPILYIGPTKSFVEKVIEPRVIKMFKSVPDLWDRLAKGKRSSKTQKIISGVTFRLAWAGSATELAGDPAAIVLVDERDRMEDDIGGEGDPVELADARHSTYADGTTVVTSTPKTGNVESKVDPVTGMEHWQVPDDAEDVQSPTWKLWQEGTRHEWAWPCPECGQYFVPRFKHLKWPKGCTAFQALTQAKLACPNCGCLLGDEHKTTMNARGVFVAPGQTVNEDGTVEGDPPESDTASFWVSGLCSPWRSFGQRARSFLAAVESGDPERVQTVINTGFGELFVVKGEAPEWEIVRNLDMPYQQGQRPDGVQLITATVDVQKKELIYTVRGWGHGAESWLLEHGEITGPTDQQEVWDLLEQLRDRTYGEMSIRMALIDSGYRADMVYPFCRKHKGWAFPVKGHDSQDKPVRRADIDINYKGKKVKRGLQLLHLNTDYFKSWVHARLERDQTLGGGWHIPEDATDDYCKQIVAETRVVKPSGKVVWIVLKKANHYLDCEMMNAAAAHILNVDKLPPVSKDAAPAAQAKQPGRRVRSKGIG